MNLLSLNLSLPLFQCFSHSLLHHPSAQSTRDCSQRCVQPSYQMLLLRCVSVRDRTLITFQPRENNNSNCTRIPEKSCGGYSAAFSCHVCVRCSCDNCGLRTRFFTAIYFARPRARNSNCRGPASFKRCQLLTRGGDGEDWR